MDGWMDERKEERKKESMDGWKKHRKKERKKGQKRMNE